MIHHKGGKLNKGADTFSSRYILLSVLESKVLGFEIVKGMYAEDEDFKEVYAKCSSPAHECSISKRAFYSKGPGFTYPSVGLESF